jgi:transglutaminase-like putative cysteine protease
MRLKIDCELGYELKAPTLFVLGVEVAQLASHIGVRESLVIAPDLPRRTYVSPETGNRLTSVLAPPGPLLVRYEAAVELQVVREHPARVPEVPIAELPLEFIEHLLPSRYSPSDRLAAFALREFDALAPGHQRVTAICNWIYDNIDYRRGASDPETSALDTLVGRAGVCRDFAHLGVAFCRALGIPARFVSCYALGLEPGDFHAVFEAWLGGRWWLFDATRQAALDGLVRIGVGRDAADVSFATFYGDAEPTGMAIGVIAEDGAPAERTVEAIRVE